MASGRENPLLLFCFVALLFVIVGWRQVLRPRLTWAWRNIFYGLLDIFKNRQLIGKKHLARDKGRVWCGTPLILARRGRGQWVLWVQASQKRRVRPCLKKKTNRKKTANCEAGQETWFTIFWFWWTLILVLAYRCGVSSPPPTFVFTLVEGWVWQAEGTAMLIVWSSHKARQLGLPAWTPSLADKIPLLHQAVATPLPLWKFSDSFCYVNEMFQA